MSKINSFLIDYLAVYVGFISVTVVRIVFIVFGDISSIGVPGYINEVFEGISLEMIFWILPSLGFVLVVHILSFFTKIIISRRVIFFLAFIAHGLVLYLWDKLESWWYIVPLYLGVILIYFLIKKYILKNPNTFLGK